MQKLRELGIEEGSFQKIKEWAFKIKKENSTRIEKISRDLNSRHINPTDLMVTHNEKERLTAINIFLDEMVLE